MKRTLLLLFVAGLLTNPVAAKTLSKVAAVVNKDIISTYQLDKAVITALANDTKGNQLTAEQFDQLRLRILEQLINEKLVDQRIAELGLTVGDTEIDAAVLDVQRKNNLSREKLEMALTAQGMDMAGYRAQLRKEILRYKLLGREVNYKVQVTESEIRDYFREHIDEYRAAPRVRVSHISYRLPADEAGRAAINKQAIITRDLLTSGEEFDKVLVGQEDVASGSDMGEVVMEELAEPLQEILQNLQVGEVSEPVEMGDQLHLFQVTAHTPGDANLYDRKKIEIEEILKKEKTEIRFKDWAKELRDNGHVEIRN